MEAAQRVFAAEYAQSQRGEKGVRIFSDGSICRRMFLVGALTEISGTPGNVMRARCADPTGAFTIEIFPEYSEAAQALSELTPPLFVAVHAKPGSGLMTLRADMLCPVERRVRDAWVLETITMTLRRMDRSPALPSENRNILVSALQRALETVPETSAQESAKDYSTIVLSILEIESGPGGMPLCDLLKRAEQSGISYDHAKLVVESLCENGECYQPKQDLIRLL